jgi:hypothetical protein
MDYTGLLNEGETLSRVARYEIGRKEGRVLIDLHEVLSGRSDARFIAMPYLTFVHCARYQFYGHGATEDEALRDCLTKIKDKTYEEIVNVNPRTGNALALKPGDCSACEDERTTRLRNPTAQR